MKNLNEDKAIEAGGKVWEKGSIRRVYLNADACKKMFADAGYGDKYTAMEEKSLKKAKTYFDVNSSTLHSDIGTVRTMFNRKDWECSK